MLDILSKVLFILTFGQFGEQNQYLNFKGGHFVEENEKQAVEKSVLSSTAEGEFHKLPHFHETLSSKHEEEMENTSLSTLTDFGRGWSDYFDFDTRGRKSEPLTFNRVKREIKDKIGNETHDGKKKITLAEEKAQGIRDVRFKRAMLLLIPSAKSLVLWGIISFLGFYSPLYNFIRDVTWATNILAFAEYYKDPPVNSILTSIVQWMNFVVWLEVIIEVHVIIISAIAAGLLLVLAPKAGKEVIVLLLVLLMMSHQ